MHNKEVVEDIEVSQKCATITLNIGLYNFHTEEELHVQCSCSATEADIKQLAPVVLLFD